MRPTFQALTPSIVFYFSKNVQRSFNGGRPFEDILFVESVSIYSLLRRKS